MSRLIRGMGHFTSPLTVVLSLDPVQSRTVTKVTPKLNNIVSELSATSGAIYTSHNSLTIYFPKLLNYVAFQPFYPAYIPRFKLT